MTALVNDVSHLSDTSVVTVLARGTQTGRQLTQRRKLLRENARKTRQLCTKAISTNVGKEANSAAITG